MSSYDPGEDFIFSINHIPQNAEELEQAIKAYVNQISSHLECSSVQVFITKHDQARNATSAIAKGTGDWFSRIGYVRTWMAKQDERLKESARDEFYSDVLMQDLPPPPTDDDGPIDDPDFD
jgi:hypothetical protein